MTDKADPKEVAQALMGVMARWESTKSGWTHEPIHELQSTIELPWHCEPPSLCNDEDRAECVESGRCGRFHTPCPEKLAECRKVEYRQVRTVMEV